MKVDDYQYYTITELESLERDLQALSSAGWLSVTPPVKPKIGDTILMRKAKPFILSA